MFNEILKHKDHLEKSGFLKIKRKEQLSKKIKELVNTRLEVSFWDNEKLNILNESLEKINMKESDPYSFVEKITG